MIKRKNKQPPTHPWVVIGNARIERRKRIRREIAESIAALRANTKKEIPSC